MQLELAQHLAPVAPVLLEEVADVAVRASVFARLMCAMRARISGRSSTG